MSSRLLVVVIALVFCAQSGHAQMPMSIGVSVFAAPQQGAPLKVVQFRKTGERDGPRVVLRNTTDVLITSFMVQATVSSPCSVESPARIHHLGSQWETIPIEPGRFVESKKPLLAPVGLLSYASTDRHAYWHVQVGVSRVQFADGTVWNSQDDNQHFTPALVEIDSNRCATWAKAPTVEKLTAVKEVKASKKYQGAGIDPQANGAIGYVMTCTITGSEAVCPSY